MDLPELPTDEKLLFFIYAGTGKDFHVDVALLDGTHIENELEGREAVLSLILDKLAFIARHAASMKVLQQMEDESYKLRQKALNPWKKVEEFMYQGGSMSLINEYCMYLETGLGIEPKIARSVLRHLEEFLSMEKGVIPDFETDRNRRPPEKIGLAIRALWRCAQISSHDYEDNWFNRKDLSRAIARIILHADLDTRDIEKLTKTVEQTIRNIELSNS